MAYLTRPAEISGVSAGSFPETAAGNRAYDRLEFYPCDRDDRKRLSSNRIFLMETGFKR